MKTEFTNYGGRCKREDLIMQRSLNEDWSVTDDGDLDTFLVDGGISGFSNYLCEACAQPFDTWVEAIAHLTKGAA